MAHTDAPAWCDSEVAVAAWRVGADIAAVHAEEVDRDARFPKEAVDGLRAAGLLGAMVPTEMGGGGASLRDTSIAIRALAVHCSATALVMAMHQIEIWYLLRFGDTDGLRGLMASAATDGVLIANANSEVGLGGEVRRSFCAVEPTDTGFHLEKQTLAISYGEAADAIVLNARRAPDAAENDQVLVACRPGTYHLQQTSEWDTTGLRGTCSNGFKVEIDESADMVFPTPWHMIGTHSVGATTILLTSTWLGIAESASAKAHAFVRADARRMIGTVPAGAALLVDISTKLGAARALMESTTAAYEAAVGTPDIDATALLLAVRNLKIAQTTTAIEIVLLASQICGIVGYRRTGPFSLDRNIRDVIGGPLMASNLRSHGDNAQLLLGMKSF